VTDAGLVAENYLVELLREKRKAFPSIAAMAQEIGGVSAQYMSKVLAGEYHPGSKIAAALGYTQVVAFVKDPNARPRTKVDERQVPLPLPVLEEMPQAPVSVEKFEF
jgi:hypothetical protein